MPHRFTEPTPTSQAGVRTVEVFVASWEIECCAPPPEVGSLSTWTLEFISADQYPSPDLDHESIWWATPWPPDAAPLVATQLSDGPVTACWSRIDVEVGAIGLRASPVDGDTRISQTSVLLDLAVPDAPGAESPRANPHRAAARDQPRRP